jgi:hypothetical protein
MGSHFRVIRIDLQRPPQLGDPVIELSLACQRNTQGVVRNRIIRPQKHRLPRMGLGLVKRAAFHERTCQVPLGGRILRVQFDDAPELDDSVVQTAEGHVRDSELHERADVVRPIRKKLLIVVGRFLEFLLA